jgi:GNAT superfamily N-acetyltransferase
MSLVFNVRMVSRNDLPALQELYLNLYDSEIMPLTSKTMKVWESILADPDHHILIGEIMGEIVSSVTLIITKNLTRNMRPNAIIENMVTHPHHRNKGCARRLINKAVEIAKEQNCYRIMFVSGATNEKTINFYIKSGFTNSEKSAYVMKL